MNTDSRNADLTGSRLIALSMTLVLFLTAKGYPVTSGENAPPIIGKIEIVSNPIFDDPGENPLAWAYRLANKLHFRTKEHVVRRELLFASGDPLDPEALAQTERNLRALVFLRDARIETVPGGDGVVDVRVLTFDAWTTVPQFRFGKVGNEIVWTLGVAERNLFGRGKWVEVGYRSDIDRDETTFLYYDPRLAGSRIVLTALASDQSDGSRGLLALGRPFFALSTRWAFNTSLEAFDQLEPIYDQGERVADLRHVRRWTEAEVARTVNKRESSATRLHIAYRQHEDEVEGDLRDFGIVQVGVSTIQHQFVKLDHVHRFERSEDFNLGNEAAAFLGVSTPVLGGEEGTVWFFSLNGKRGVRLDGEHILWAAVSWSARHRRDVLENSLATVRLDYLQRHSRRWLLLGVGELVQGSHLDPEVQVRLGAERGLRGYPVRQFVGTRSLRFNLEERFFIADDLAQLASFAAAAFFDTGYAWPEGQPMRLEDLKSDVGLSLLVGRNRLGTTTPGFRLDLAYALNPIPGRSRWLVSFGSRIGL